MYYHHRTRNTLIGGALLAGVAAMFLIPGDPDAVVATSTPVQVASMTSAETVAAIDAMLGTSVTPAAASETSKPAREPYTPVAYQPPTAVADVPADVTEPETPPAPAIDPSLRADAIGSSAVNLRAGPSSDTATVTVLQPGQPIYVGMSQDGWSEVTLENGSTGWVFSRYIASERAKEPEPVQPKVAAAEEPRAATVSGGSGRELAGRTARIESSLVVRSSPSNTGRSLFRTEPGERVRIIDVDGNWLRIRTADGSSGWIRAS